MCASAHVDHHFLFCSVSFAFTSCIIGDFLLLRKHVEPAESFSFTFKKLPFIYCVCVCAWCAWLVHCHCSRPSNQIASGARSFGALKRVDFSITRLFCYRLLFETTGRSVCHFTKYCFVSSSVRVLVCLRRSGMIKSCQESENNCLW